MTWVQFWLHWNGSSCPKWVPKASPQASLLSAPVLRVATVLLLRVAIGVASCHITPRYRWNGHCDNLSSSVFVKSLHFTEDEYRFLSFGRHRKRKFPRSSRRSVEGQLSNQRRWYYFLRLVRMRILLYKNFNPIVKLSLKWSFGPLPVQCPKCVRGSVTKWEHGNWFLIIIHFPEWIWCWLARVVRPFQ